MRVTTAIGVLSLLLLVLASVALAQAGAQGVASGPVLHGTSDEYRLHWWALSPGGSAAGGPYTMECAAGQAEAGLLISDKYALTGGISYGVPEPALPTSTPTSTTPPAPTPSPTGPAPGAHCVYLPLTLRE